MNNTVKMEFYDRFRCIADKCSFTCCQNWDILVDEDTLGKWKSDEKQSEAFCKNVKSKKRNRKTEYYIKMNPRKGCPFLNEKGLCNIVISNGDEYLSKACRAFPRQENNFGDLDEYSLSCACPAVVDIIYNIDGTVKFLHDADDNLMDNLLPEYKIREVMMSIMQNCNFSLTDKILLTFHMLLSVKEEPGMAAEIRKKYQSEEYLSSLTGIWSGIKIDNEDSFQETKELFLDIILNYKKEMTFRDYLQGIADLAEDEEIDDNLFLTQWNDFKMEFVQYEKLMENCIISKIFANCVSEDIDEMLLAFQVVITEYIMVRYSVFLKSLLEEKYCNESQPQTTKKVRTNNIIPYNITRDYIVIYSRIIGYNADGIREFWEDSFEEAVWEFGYMLLLIN
ncbi:MAG: flagellin lysine-N-methylase [Herbinix sp.]|nr:flagellin lysine-N-methylase [Herbinix sp.]